MVVTRALLEFKEENSGSLLYTFFRFFIVLRMLMNANGSVRCSAYMYDTYFVVVHRSGIRL